MLEIPSSVMEHEVKSSVLAALTQDWEECIRDNADKRLNVISHPLADGSLWRAKSDALQKASQRVAKLHQVESRQGSQVSDYIQALTVFETLCALSKGERDKTRYPVCLCNLGGSLDLPCGEWSALSRKRKQG